MNVTKKKKKTYKRNKQAYLTSLGNILCSKHGCIGWGFIPISFHLHTTCLRTMDTLQNATNQNSHVSYSKNNGQWKLRNTPIKTRKRVTKRNITAQSKAISYQWYGPRFPFRTSQSHAAIKEMEYLYIIKLQIQTRKRKHRSHDRSGTYNEGVIEWGKDMGNPKDMLSFSNSGSKSNSLLLGLPSFSFRLQRERPAKISSRESKSIYHVRWTKKDSTYYGNALARIQVNNCKFSYL